MANEVIMPKAGMSMETGTVVKWFKNVGETIDKGEALLEIETDKVNMEVESMASGTVLKILAEAGDVIPVTDVIAYIGEEGEELPDAKEVATEKEETKIAAPVDKPAKKALTQEGEKVPSTPLAKRLAKEKGINLSDITPSGKYGEVRGRDIPDITENKVTPLARNIAEAEGINLDDIEGSGHKGKITKRDVLDAGVVSLQSSDSVDLIPHSAMRKVIASRMLKSHIEIPPVTQSCIADVTELLEFRKKINEKIKDSKVSVNDIIIMAVAKTLREQPHINASFSDEGMMIKKDINIGVAVALPEGLIVPVIKDADKRTLGSISAEVKKLAQKAKSGKLMPDEFSGGTFTISNLGMMGVTSFTPIINQPESAILGVCAVQQKLEMDDDGNILKKMKMGLSLTYDHRSIDGAQAAIFSNRIVEFLENPVLMLV